jgi:Fur family ferric uptake transcriptional regulator
VTVYRCLSTFQEIGLVRLSYFHNGASAYQITLNSAAETPYHIISKKDDEVWELDAESASELRAVIAKVEDRLRASGNGKVSHIVEFFVEGASALAQPVPRGRQIGIVERLPVALQMRNIAGTVIPTGI